MSNKLIQVKEMVDENLSKKAIEYIDGFYFDQLKELYTYLNESKMST